MTYLNRFSIKPLPQAGGIILVDILLALSLSLIFIVAIVDASSSAREIFYKAKEKNDLLDAYQAGANLGQLQYTSEPYGNDREEMTATVADTGGASSTSVSYVSIVPRSGVGVDTLNQFALCSVDYTYDSVIGSYEWLRHQTESTSTYSLDITVKPYSLPISQTIPLTDLEIRNDIAYVSTDSNIASDPDILVFKLNNNGSSALLSYLNTGPGITSIAVSGKYIYAAAPSTVGQLHIIEQDQARSLSLVKKYQLPLPYATATPALGSSIAYADGHIYFGSEKWVGDEFSVIDVNNPAAPTKLGGIKIGAKVGDIFAHDGTAFTASADQQQLRMVDVRDLTHPIVVAGFSPAGWQRQEGQTLTLFEGRLDFGRTAGGYNYVNEHEAFTLPTTSPFVQGDFESADMPGGVYGMISDRLREYVISRQSGKEFQIFDHSMAASSSLSFALPTLPQAMTCYGDKIYVLSHTSPVIYEIKIIKK